MKNAKLPYLTYALMLLPAANCLTPALAEDDLKPVTSVEGITEYHLDNGLQVLLFPDSSKQTVTVNVTYLVGSRHEGRGETGMAHLLEHMVFKGTPDHPDIWKALQDHGARFNGTTWVDRTNYYETLPTTEPGNLEWALRMEADRMVNSNIFGEVLQKEFSVVRNEFEMGENSPINILIERITSAAYIWHNYGKSTIGSKSDIERVPVENLKAFYKKYYQPDNATLVVAGDFKPAEALRLIQKHFGAIPRPQRKLADTYTIEPVQDGARFVELRRVGDLAACGSVYHVCAASHPDFAALDVIENILTDEPSGRLYKALIESGMAASVFGYAFGYKEPGIVLNMAVVRKEDPVGPVMKKINGIVEGLSADPITDEEVKRAKNSLLKDIELAMKSSGRIGVELSEWVAAGDWRLFFLHRDRLEKVTTEQVRRVAAHYFKESNRTAGIYYPTVMDNIDRVEVPDTPNVLALVRDYEGREALSEGEEFEATPENIESRVTRKTLPNGAKLAWLRKETRGDAVRAVMTLRFGTEKDIQGRQDTIDLIPQMVMRGTKNHTYQQIQDKLDELKASVSVYGGGMFRAGYGAVNVSIKTDHDHLPAVIKLVGEILTQPTFPTSEFDIVKKENLAGLENQLSEPQPLAMVSIMRRLNPWPSDNVRYVPTIAESIERLKAVEVDDLREFHKKYYGASNACITVVGDFDEAKVTKAIEEAVGKWKSPKPFKRIESIFRGDVKGSDDIIQTPDKKMAMVACGLNVKMSDQSPDYTAMHLANYVLGASAKSRLLERMRQKEGLSYGAGSYFNANSHDESAVLFGMGICAPDNAKKAFGCLVEEISILVRDGVGVEELADAKASFALQVKNQLANDRTVARILNQGLYLKRTMMDKKELYDKIAALTPAKIQKALKKHVALDRLVTVKAGDLKTDSLETSD